jgi:hypothetical protein
VGSALSPKAGIILGIANCFEMGFLGIALTLRVRKCTGSAYWHRIMAIIVPPLCMLLMSWVGGYAGDISATDPFLFAAFVAFGIVALLSLVCNELLIDASHAEVNVNCRRIVFCLPGLFFSLFKPHHITIPHTDISLILLPKRATTTSGGFPL